MNLENKGNSILILASLSSTFYFLSSTPSSRIWCSEWTDRWVREAEVRRWKAWSQPLTPSLMSLHALPTLFPSHITSSLMPSWVLVNSKERYISPPARFTHSLILSPLSSPITHTPPSMRMNEETVRERTRMNGEDMEIRDEWIDRCVRCMKVRYGEGREYGGCKPRPSSRNLR